jgi:hypothetical protein
MKQLTTLQAAVMITTSQGRIFNVKFTKRNGEERSLNGKFQSKGQNSKRLKFNPTSQNLLSVFDVTKKGYRFVSLDTLHYLALDGQRFQVID